MLEKNDINCKYHQAINISSCGELPAAINALQRNIAADNWSEVRNFKTTTTLTVEITGYSGSNNLSVSQSVNKRVSQSSSESVEQ
jgi:hypothetical protein